MGLVIPRDQKILNAGRVKSQIVPIKPPMTGWNTRDAFEFMEPADAITMNNWYADVGGMIIRKGSKPFATGFGASVKTLAEYYAGATRKFVAAAAGGLYEISTGTRVSAGHGF